MKPGPHTMRGKRKYPLEELVEQTAKTIIAGKGIKTSPFLQAANVSQSDRVLLAKIANTTVEEFNRQLSVKLAAASDKLANRVLNEAQDIPLQSVAFTMAVMEDKRARLDGHNALAAAGGINVQINHFNGGGKTKEQIIAELSGEAIPTEVSQITPQPTTNAAVKDAE